MYVNVYAWTIKLSGVYASLEICKFLSPFKCVDDKNDKNQYHVTNVAAAVRRTKVSVLFSCYQYAHESSVIMEI